MLLPRRARYDPTSNRFDLSRCEALIGIDRGHAYVFFVTADTGKDLAFFRMARHNRAQSRIPLIQGAFLNIQSQTALTVVFIRTMTGETSVRQERPDISIEVNCCFIPGYHTCHAECSCQ